MIAQSKRYKVDLHIHTPASSCYEGLASGSILPDTVRRQIVAVALDNALDAIAVCDHNSIEGLEDMRALAANALRVFPATEITARGGHVLALFDLDTPADAVRDLLVALGLPEEHWGQGFRESPLWVDEVCARIAASGGVAIAAHADRQPRGFIASPEATEDKVRIYSSAYLSAIEITDPRRKPLWNQGRVPFYARPIACVQGSDAHSPAEVGRRPVYLDVPSLELAGVRLALEEYQGRVRFPHELEPCQESA